MENLGKINQTFLNVTDAKTKNTVLQFVANQYGIDLQQAYEELIDENAEHLLDYLSGSIRAAVSVLMQMRGLPI